MTFMSTVILLRRYTPNFSNPIVTPAHTLKHTAQSVTRIFALSINWLYLPSMKRSMLFSISLAVLLVYQTRALYFG